MNKTKIKVMVWNFGLPLSCLVNQSRKTSHVEYVENYVDFSYSLSRKTNA